MKSKKSLVKAQKDAIGKKDHEIQKMAAEKDALVQKMNDDELNLKTLVNTIEKTQKEVEKSEHAVSSMKKLRNYDVGISLPC